MKNLTNEELSTPAPTWWEKEFDNLFPQLGIVEVLHWKEESNFGCNELCTEYVKQFIRQTIQWSLINAKDQ